MKSIVLKLLATLTFLHCVTFAIDMDLEMERHKQFMTDNSISNPGKADESDIDTKIRLQVKLFNDIRVQMGSVTKYIVKLLEHNITDLLKYYRGSETIKQAMEKLIRSAIKDMEDTSAIVEEKFLGMLEIGEPAYHASMKTLEEKKTIKSKSLRSKFVENSDVDEHVELLFKHWQETYVTCTKKFFSSSNDFFHQWTDMLDGIQARIDKAFNETHMMGHSKKEAIIELERIAKRNQNDLNSFKEYITYKLDKSLDDITRCRSSVLLD